jgi:butyrate kinase
MRGSEFLILEKLRTAIERIAPVVVYPGADELQALAEGALRILHGEEGFREYFGCESLSKISID